MSQSNSNLEPFFPKSDGIASSAPDRSAGESTVVFIHSHLDDYGLSPSTFRVYCHLARRAGHGSAWPAIAKIARVCRLHPQTVRKALRLLVAHRLLQREDRPGDTALYRLTPASAWQPPKRIDGNPSETDTAASVSQDSPAKRIKGQPFEMDTAEGNPSEGNPAKTLKAYLAHRLPSSEDEAVKEAHNFGVPADFTRREFNRMVSVGWLDGCKRPVRSWPHYIKQRWSKEQSERGERHVAARRTAKRAPQPPRKFKSGDYQQPVEEF